MAKTVRIRLTRATLRLLRADEGVTAIEYGLIASLIAAVVLIGLSAIGSSLHGQLSQLGAAIAAAQSHGGGSSGNNGNGKGGCGGGQGTNGC